MSEIVSKYSQRLYWVLRSFASSHEETDDLLQDTFIKAWQGLPSFREESGLFTWVYRIAVNVGLNNVRKKKWEALLTRENLDLITERMVDDDPMFDGDAARRELTKAIVTLPPTQRAVFILRYYQDLPYEQISEILSSSVGSLKVSYHKACQKIKERLQDEIDLPEL
ncbi:MAG: RNA polymerase sigma factor [Bacteroidales bacterium]|nr:RNA polymerase sigma factor [Bacteroidales bacterium]